MSHNITSYNAFVLQEKRKSLVCIYSQLKRSPVDVITIRYFFLKLLYHNSVMRSEINLKKQFINWMLGQYLVKLLSCCFHTTLPEFGIWNTISSNIVGRNEKYSESQSMVPMIFKKYCSYIFGQFFFFFFFNKQCLRYSFASYSHILHNTFRRLLDDLDATFVSEVYIEHQNK